MNFNSKHCRKLWNTCNYAQNLLLAFIQIKFQSNRYVFRILGTSLVSIADLQKDFRKKMSGGEDDFSFKYYRKSKKQKKKCY